jgi:hypothetical protein
MPSRSAKTNKTPAARSSRPEGTRKSRQGSAIEAFQRSHQSDGSSAESGPQEEDVSRAKTPA